MAVRFISRLSAEEPLWSRSSNLILNDKLPTNIRGVELVEAGIELAVRLARIAELALSQGVIEAEKVE